MDLFAQFHLRLWIWKLVSSRTDTRYKQVKEVIMKYPLNRGKKRLLKTYHMSVRQDYGLEFGANANPVNLRPIPTYNITDHRHVCLLKIVREKWLGVDIYI